jgi:hypothetical protein
MTKKVKAQRYGGKFYVNSVKGRGVWHFNHRRRKHNMWKEKVLICERRQIWGTQQVMTFDLVTKPPTWLTHMHFIPACWERYVWRLKRLETHLLKSTLEPSPRCLLASAPIDSLVHTSSALIHSIPKLLLHWSFWAFITPMSTCLLFDTFSLRPTYLYDNFDL